MHWTSTNEVAFKMQSCKDPESTEDLGHVLLIASCIIPAKDSRVACRGPGWYRRVEVVIGIAGRDSEVIRRIWTVIAATRHGLALSTMTVSPPEITHASLP